MNRPRNTTAIDLMLQRNISSNAMEEIKTKTAKRIRNLLKQKTVKTNWTARKETLLFYLEARLKRLRAL